MCLNKYNVQKHMNTLIESFIITEGNSLASHISDHLMEMSTLQGI